MSLLGFKARNHPQQIPQSGTRLFDVSETVDVHASVDDRGTDPLFFDALDERFRFTLDVAAAHHNAKCERYYTADDDGLAMAWTGQRVWCNPPYSNIRPWLERAWSVWRRGECDLIAMLLPANRTEQGWWQELVEPFRDGKVMGFTTEFLPGRLRFIAPGATGPIPNDRPPFGCVLLVWATETETP